MQKRLPLDKKRASLASAHNGVREPSLQPTTHRLGVGLLLRAGGVLQRTMQNSRFAQSSTPLRLCKSWQGAEDIVSPFPSAAGVFARRQCLIPAHES
jgi:hypothetical protein